MSNVVYLEDFKKTRAIKEFNKMASEVPTIEDWYLLFWNVQPEEVVSFIDWLGDIKINKTEE